MNEIKIFSPATVANVSCGFDALGFALNTLGDEMIFRKTPTIGVKIAKIEGAKLSLNINENVVGVVAQEMLKKHPANFGIEIEIYKNFKPGSGLGSSAASAAGTAFAVNKLLGNPFLIVELIQFAMLGEQAACGSQIADNVSAVLFGGFVLVRSYQPLDIVKLPTPNELVATVIHPQIEVKTEDARNVLKSEVPLKDAITQWANVGGLISGLYSNDYDLIGRSLTDVIVEPVRKHLIPHFDEIKNAATESGALGAGISGSGPTIFALSKGEIIANKVAESMRHVYSKTNIDFEIYTSKINPQGIKILDQQ
jgi:homoserine kinase